VMTLRVGPLPLPPSPTFIRARPVQPRRVASVATARNVNADGAARAVNGRQGPPSFQTDRRRQFCYSFIWAGTLGRRRPVIVLFGQINFPREN
jgi:hypothetical protein